MRIKLSTIVVRSLLILSFSLVCNAQSISTISPSQVIGLDIVGPTDPEFENEVEALIPELTAREILGDVLPMSVIVRNNSGRGVVFLVVQHTFINSGGVPVTGTIRHDLRRKGKLRHGDTVLVSPGGVLRATSDAALTEQAARRTTEASTLALVKRSPTLEVSLDAVMFEGGEFSGPDKALTFDYLAQNRSHLEALISGLKDLGYGPEEVLRASLGKIESKQLDLTEGVEHAQGDAEAVNVVGRNLRGSNMDRIIAGALAKALDDGGIVAFQELLGYLENLFVGMPAWRAEGR